MKYYDENKNLVNFSNSLLKNYGIKTFHSTIAKIDKLLENKKYKKIAILLFDGLGTYIQNCHLDKNSSLVNNRFIEITSVFPPTTVAATTALLSARYPKETGYLGWNQYFIKEDMQLEMFTGKDYREGKFYNTDLINKLNYESITQMIEQKTDINVKSVYAYPVNKQGAKNIFEFMNEVDIETKKDENLFLYGYYPNPDHYIHLYGVNSKIVHDEIFKIDNLVEKYANENKDTLIIVLADHGLVDVEVDYIEDHNDFNDLVKCRSIDARVYSMHLKDRNKKDEFLNLFNKYYKDNYDIYSHDEVLKYDIFGKGTPHKMFEDFVGEFLIIAKSNKYFDSINAKNYFVGAHSGGLDEEKYIYISIYNK